MSTKINHSNLNNTLVAVSAKEHGKLFQIKDNQLHLLDYVAEHPPTHSDDEGFFWSSSDGENLGSGYPKETDDKRNLDRYLNAIGGELSEAVKKINPDKILVLEPEHYKGLIEENLINPDHIPVEIIEYGNFVEHSVDDIAELINEHYQEDLDPADPASVAGEENAEEKRKILETAQLRYSN